MSEDRSPYAAGAERPVLGLARMRRQLARTRVLLAITLVVLLVVGVWSVVGIASLNATVSSLQSKVDRVQADAAAAASAAASAAAPSAAAPEKSVGAAVALGADVIRPAGADEAGAIVVGDPNAATVVEVFVDYQCPYCQKWEEQIGGPLMAKALQPGSGLMVKQYNLAFLKEANRDLKPAGASARAASAAACILDTDGAETFVAFSKAVFASADPTEPDGQFTDAVLSTVAGSVGASPQAIGCITEERFVPFVSATTKAGFARGVTGTPTVLINGQVLQNSFTDPALLALVQG